MKAGDKTKEKILKAGLKLWPDVTFTKVARALELNSHANVVYHFKTNKVLKNAVAEYAVKTGDSKVIMQLIAAKHATVKKLSQAERIRHFNAVTV